MKQISLFIAILFSAQLIAQQQPEFSLTVPEVEADLRFIASDELQGRRTGEAGNNIAAKYIAEAYRAAGVQAPEGMEDYMQTINFGKSQVPAEGTLVWGESTYQHMEDMIVLGGIPLDATAKAVFAGHGLENEKKGWDDYKGIKAEGKIVVVMGGIPNSQDPLETFNAMQAKRDLAQSKGAIALIEIYRLPFPWGFFKNYMTSDRLTPKSESTRENTMSYLWIKEKDPEATLLLKKKKTELSVKHNGVTESSVKSQNVIGIIPGTDSTLKNEFIALTAHYDHVGTGKNGGSFYTPEDSIFNGARDNGMGTVALISAAKALAKKPAKRSILLIAFTGEEMGLLGSQYYASNPVIPLTETIFNFNTDGAGYNDKSSISVIGYGRTGTDDAIQAGAKAFGMGVIENPAPDQNLFDRSDNVAFAAKGVPCANFSPGVTGFEEELMKYYHQAADNPESVDFDYLLKYVQTYIHTARIIADAPVKPKWTAGDKYEEIGKKLYGLE